MYKTKAILLPQLLLQESEDIGVEIAPILDTSLEILESKESGADTPQKSSSSQSTTSPFSPLKFFEKQFENHSSDSATKSAPSSPSNSFQLRKMEQCSKKTDVPWSAESTLQQLKVSSNLHSWVKDKIEPHSAKHSLRHFDATINPYAWLVTSGEKSESTRYPLRRASENPKRTVNTFLVPLASRRSVTSSNEKSLHSKFMSQEIDKFKCSLGINNSIEVLCFAVGVEGKLKNYLREAKVKQTLAKSTDSKTKEPTANKDQIEEIFQKNGHTFLKWFSIIRKLFPAEPKYFQKIVDKLIELAAKKTEDLHQQHVLLSNLKKFLKSIKNCIRQEEHIFQKQGKIKEFPKLIQ